MRWKYLIPRVVIVALVWGFFVWAFDPLVRWSLTKSAEKVNRAKVDLAEVSTQFAPPRVQMKNVQIADRGKPGRNRVQFDSFDVQLSGEALSHRKIVIEHGRLTGLMWNTPRADSGQLEPGKDFDFTPRLPLDELRDKVSELGKTWLKDALKAAKSQVDPKQLETVQVADALKQRWLARFQSYETRINQFDDRIKALKENAKPKGNTLEKIQAYQQVALEVQQLLKDVETLRNEFAQIGPMAQADLLKIEQAKQRDLASAQQKLQILTLDKDAITEALLGPELIAAIEENLHWVEWTKDKLGDVTAVKEPERSRGVDIKFPQPGDPHPDFLIKELEISGQARVNGFWVPYRGTIKNISSDPKRWRQPLVLDLFVDAKAKIHLTSSLELGGETPVYHMAIHSHLPEPLEFECGDAENMAVRISAAETTWDANLTVRGSAVDGTMQLQQSGVTIGTYSSQVPAPVQVAAVQPVSFEWDPDVELQRALNGVLGNVQSLEATVQMSGDATRPEWKISSNLGTQVAEGVSGYFAGEMQRRQQQLFAMASQKADEHLAGFRAVLGEKFRETSGHLNLTETQAKSLLEKSVGRPLDVRSFFRR